MVFHGKKKTHVHLLSATLATRRLDLKENTALPLGRVLRKLINFIQAVCQSSPAATAIELNIVSGVRSSFRESALICTVLPSNAGWLDGSKTRMYHARLNWGWVSHTRYHILLSELHLSPGSSSYVSMATCPASHYPEREWMLTTLLRVCASCCFCFETNLRLQFLCGGRTCYHSGNAALCSLI